MTELEKHQAHRIECLEAKVRAYRQAARVLADAALVVIAGFDSSELEEDAWRVLELIAQDEKAPIP